MSLGRCLPSVKVPTALTGCQVWRTAFGYEVRLTLIARDRTRATASMPNRSSKRRSCRASITTVAIRKRGALALTFDSRELFIGADPRFESWHLTGDGVDHITLGPGGHTD
ncbi:DUF6188 family protein [Dactylosporangium sp. CA-139114]|uniref:DUF6188 family protein n=1 Tax=Dactylosporangium sp. CA-139114 TaxID=3239931 RepID=UPI003D9688C2